MKVKLLTLMAGPEGTFSPGAVLDLEAEKAKVLVAGGYAILLETEPKHEPNIKKPEQNPRKKVKPKKGGDISGINHKRKSKSILGNSR